MRIEEVEKDADWQVRTVSDLAERLRIGTVPT
jgi:hypothetical protein